MTKIETPVEQEEKMEEISLQEFKECPIEYLKEASLKEYEIEGNEDEIELEYDQMTDSDIEKEVETRKPVGFMQSCFLCWFPCGYLNNTWCPYGHHMASMWKPCDVL